MSTAAAPGWVDRVIGSTQRARVYHYTKYTLYSFAGLSALAIPVNLPQWITYNGLPAGAAMGLLTVLFVAANIQLTRLGLRWYLDQGGEDSPPWPGRLLAAQGGLALLITAWVIGSVAFGTAPEASLAVLISLYSFGVCGASLLLSLRQLWAGLGVLLAVLALGGLLAGLPGRMTLLMTAVTGILVVLMAFTCRVTAWTLRVVNKLDAARETEARLAVAEERLRFGRDMHDVLGRNLSVIALKSELAAQLARRGSPAAVDQMTEVQQIARQSQQEMREVVRGYREADLQAELAGARGVLEAAGIACRIEDGGSTGLPVGVQSALGWVVREGTTNVLRHADATACVIRLRPPGRGGITAVLEMENDGVRARAAGAEDGAPAGTGLLGLRDRLAVLGGALAAGAYGDGHGGGTGAGGEGVSFRITATVPVVAAPSHTAERVSA
ncbi:sensor histidine kinase [Streptomyces sp. NPDC059853]|uniref:sensor histidine kinase n=1 Tax=Streptomyces sp. NPDC059853 TaxID=3346973 RepID=UPI0036564F10